MTFFSSSSQRQLEVFAISNQESVSVILDGLGDCVINVMSDGMEACVMCAYQQLAVVCSASAQYETSHMYSYKLQ